MPLSGDWRALAGFGQCAVGAAGKELGAGSWGAGRRLCAVRRGLAPPGTFYWSRVGRRASERARQGKARQGSRLRRRAAGSSQKRRERD